ncbi:MAG: hypothetical protein KC421_16370, partial [Anaerolineales bacterium]|nr:hypothetical protein [Anaerolineales bacterium]
MQLTLADLQDAGLPIQQLDPAQLSLSSRETAVPYTIANNTITFEGQAATDRYTAAHTYILEVGKPGQLAETAVSSAPVHSTIHLEENTVYESRARTPSHSATWFWHAIQPGSVITITATLPDHATGPWSLTMALWGLSANSDITPDHDLDVRLNGQPLTTLQWDGAAALTETIDLPPNELHPGSNQITFDNPTADNPVDVMLLDWVEIKYTSPGSASHSTNQQTVKPTDLSLARRPS